MWRSFADLVRGYAQTFHSIIYPCSQGFTEENNLVSWYLHTTIHCFVSCNVTSREIPLHIHPGLGTVASEHK